MAKKRHRTKKYISYRKSSKKIAKHVLLFLLAALAVYACIQGIIYYRQYKNLGGVGQGISVPQRYQLYGIDVSTHQGDIHWDELRLGLDNEHCTSVNEEECSEFYPISFAYIKATEGESHLDNRYFKNIRSARQVGIAAGSYHYFKPNKSARVQARHFLDEASIMPGDLPPALDVEETGRLSYAQLCDSVLVWLQCVEQEVGAKPIIYANLHYSNRVLTNPRLRSYRFWVAHYKDGEKPARDFWNFWQFTDKGEVFGIRAHVDINVFCADLNYFDSLILL